MHYAEQVWAKRAKVEERQNNIGIFIDGFRSVGHSDEVIAAKLMELYKLSRKEAIAQVKARLSGNVSSSPALS